MAASLSFLNKDIGAGNNIVWKNFQCTLSGNYTNSGAAANVGTPGETLSFNTALNPKYLSRPRIPNGGSTGQLLAASDFIVQLPQGYDGIVEKNATNPTANNYVLRIFTTSATELNAGAYPAALIAEPFLIKVRVPSKYA